MRTEMPTLLAVTAGTGLLILDVELGRTDAILMIAALALIMWQLVRSSKDPVIAGEIRRRSSTRTSRASAPAPR